MRGVLESDGESKTILGQTLDSLTIEDDLHLRRPWSVPEVESTCWLVRVGEVSGGGTVVVYTDEGQGRCRTIYDLTQERRRRQYTIRNGETL